MIDSINRGSSRVTAASQVKDIEHDRTRVFLNATHIQSPTDLDYDELLKFKASKMKKPKVLITGHGDGTYYFDYTGKACPGQPIDPENNGITSCEPSAPPYQTLGQRRNNYIVALAEDQMNGNKAKYCGKRVIVSYNGKVVSGNFVVWDSCAACVGGVRLDFSLSALQHINSDACNLGVVPGVSWQVVDEQIIPYIP